MLINPHIKTLTQVLIFRYREKQHYFHISFLVCCISIIYWQVHRFQFLNGWDDQWFITNHYTEDGFQRHNLYAILKDFYYGQYAPVNQLYYTFLFHVFGYKPSSFHVAGVILHLINTILVYFTFRNICIQVSSFSNLCNNLVGFVTSLLFAISPFNLEPVAWVAASKVLLYALFYLVAINWYIQYIVTGKPGYYYLTILFFFISFGAKEQAVTLPVCLLLLDYIYKRDLKKGVIWFEKIPLFVLSVLFGLITIQSQGEEIMDSTHVYSVYQRLVLSFYTLSEYLTKTILPVNISFLYPFPFPIGASLPIWLWVYPAAIVLITICFWSLFKKRWLFAGVAFFLIHILLVINLVSLARYAVVADRYAYLSTAGIYFILAYAGVQLYHSNRFRRLISYTGIIYIGYFMAYTSFHCPVWLDVHSLKEKIRITIKSRADFKNWEKQK